MNVLVDVTGLNRDGGIVGGHQRLGLQLGIRGGAEGSATGEATRPVMNAAMVRLRVLVLERMNLPLIVLGDE
jgi:hypothetical protein